MVGKSTVKIALLLTYAIFFLFGISIGMIDPITPILAAELGISYTKIGLVIFYSVIFLLLSNILSGYSSDRLDMKKIIISGVVLVSAGLFFFGLYLDFITLIIYLILIRVGFGALDPTTYNYYTEFFRGKERTSVFIKINLSWLMGLVVGPLLISAGLLVGINPRMVFIFVSIAFLVLITLFGFFSPRIKRKEDSTGRKRVQNLREVFSSPYFIITGLVYLFYSGSVFGLATWLTTYFLDFDIQISASSFFLSLYWLASIAGLVITLKIRSRFSEKKIFLASLISGTVCALVVALSSDIIVKVVFIGLQGISLAAVMPLIKTIAVNKKPMMAGTIVGFILMSQGLGILIFQPLLGLIADTLGRANMIFAVLAGLFIALVLGIVIYRYRDTRKL